MTCVYLAAAVAVVLAWIVAGSHRGHRPVAFLLSGGILVRGSLLLWDAYVLAPLTPNDLRTPPAPIDRFRKRHAFSAELRCWA